MSIKQTKDIDARLEKIELALDLLTQKIIPLISESITDIDTRTKTIIKVLGFQEKAIKEMQNVA